MGSLAIIPARSGSKGLPDKNILLLAGKPLMAHSIEAALDSSCFEDVVVSTDSAQYAEIAESYGAWVPFLRPDDLSGDTAGSWAVVEHCLARLSSDYGKSYETVMLLQPTSPLRSADDIRSAFSLFNERKAKAVVSVCEVDHSPQWCNTLGKDCSMDGFLSRTHSVGRQQLGTYYRINGAMYLVRTSLVQPPYDLYLDGSYALVMDKWRSVDIDDEFDFAYAAFLKSQMPLRAKKG